MKKYYSWIFAFAIIVAVVLAGVLILAPGKKQSSKTTQPTQVTQTTQNPTNQSANGKAAQGINFKRTTIKVTASGFNPQTIKIQKGTIVIWVNQSGADASVNSDDHPTNLLYPELNLGRFSNGSSMTVSFNKTGKYTYHNELNLDQKGTIIVQ
jgi:plastocyanin